MQERYRIFRRAVQRTFHTIYPVPNHYSEIVSFNLRLFRRPIDIKCFLHFEPDLVAQKSD